MTVELPWTSPLQTWAERFADLPDGVQIAEEPFLAMIDLRVDPAGPAAGSIFAAVRAHLGVALPTTPSTWVDGDAARVIWLGPDEWLVTSQLHSPQDLEAGLRAALMLGPASDPAAVGAGGGAVVDVSAQRTTLRLRGEHVRDLLATGCAVDLHPRAFPAGSAAQTTLGLAGVVLLALDDAATHYQLLVRSSFAWYLAAWLVDASTEFGAPVRNAS